MSDFLIGDSRSGSRLDGEHVKKLVHEEVDRERRYLEFAQNQANADRAYFKYLFGWTATFIAALVIAAGFFGYRSVEQLRDDVKTSVDAELQKAHNDVSGAVDGMKSEARKELASTRTEVRKRIDDEFRTDQITTLVRTAAKDRTEGELQGIIRSETATQVAKGIQDQAPAIQRTVEDETKRAVRDLQPTINSIVGSETQAQVQKSVVPIQSQLKVYGDLIRTGTLATLAKSDDRSAFDELVRIAIGSIPATNDEKRVANSTVVAIIREVTSGLHLGYQFKEKQTTESMKKILVTSRFANDKIAAIDNYPREDRSILPLLVQLIEFDGSITVVNTAFRHFNALTKQSFQFPDYAAVETWWNQNKESFQ